MKLSKKTKAIIDSALHKALIETGENHYIDFSKDLSDLNDEQTEKFSMLSDFIDAARSNILTGLENYGKK